MKGREETGGGVERLNVEWLTVEGHFRVPSMQWVTSLTMGLDSVPQGSKVDTGSQETRG